MDALDSELLLAISSAIAAFISAIAAFWTYRRDLRKDHREERSLDLQEEEALRRRIDQVNDDTVGLYRQLADTYQSVTDKDRAFLRKITFVIRRLLVLERSVNDIVSEMEVRWDAHSDEAISIGCPFYTGLNDYFWIRITSLEKQLSDTMNEVDKILLNGTGKETK